MAKKPHDPALLRIFDLLGNASRVAEVCGVSRAAVSNWKRLPPRHLKAISALTGLPYEKLRPDLWKDDKR